MLYGEERRPLCQKYHLKYCYNANIEKHYVLSPGFVKSELDREDRTVT